jgi:cytochrome P450
LDLQFPQADAILKETLRLIPPGAIAARFTEQGYQLTPKVCSAASQFASSSCGVTTMV